MVFLECGVCEWVGVLVLVLVLWVDVVGMMKFCGGWGFWDVGLVCGIVLKVIVLLCCRCMLIGC